MNHDIALQITNAKRRVDKIKELNTAFLRHLTAHSQPESVPSELLAKDDRISVDCFSCTAIAKPRIVRSSDGMFSMEYVFRVVIEHTEHELWRFYLSHNGQLETSLEEGEPICDHNNRFVAEHLCEAVLYSALNSVLFAPKGSS